MEEIWKDICFIEDNKIYDFVGLYQISNTGRVKSLGNDKNKKEKILKQTYDKKGYLVINLSKNGTIKKFFVHRLVAYMFIQNDDLINKTEVNHINEFEKDNNCINNLEWCTKKYNNNYGTRNKRVSKNMKYKNKGYLVDRFDLNGNYIDTYYNFEYCQMGLGFDNSTISKCCKGKRKSHKGFIFKYHN